MLSSPLIIFLVLQIIFYVKSQDYHVLSFGAKGDGVSDDTLPIRSAFQAAENSNGGRVIFDEGYIFLTGAFRFKNNIILDIRGTILGSNNSQDYYLDGARVPALINAYYHSSNITFTGGGTIDGQGFYWWPCAYNLSQLPCLGARPSLIRLFEISDLKINNLLVTNSGMFNLFIRGQNVHIYNVSIVNPDYSIAPNTDGIHFDSVQNAVVEDCYISTGDDSFGINSDYGNPPTNNITIRNINVGLSHGLSIGARTNSGVQNILFENIIMNGSIAGPNIRSISNWGGNITNITYSNITVYNTNECFILEMNWTYDPPPPYNFTFTPSLKNITIKNFTCINSNFGARISGLDTSKIDATFENIKLLNIKNKTYHECKNIYGSCDNSTFLPYCPLCMDSKLCEDKSTDCSGYLPYCTNTQYHNLLCNKCRKTCNICHSCD